MCSVEDQENNYVFSSRPRKILKVKTKNVNTPLFHDYKMNIFF